jgi:hypothetical protein
VLLTYFYLVEGLSGIVFVIIFLLSYFSYIFKFFIKLAMKEKKKKKKTFGSHLLARWVNVRSEILCFSLCMDLLSAVVYWLAKYCVDTWLCRLQPTGFEPTTSPSTLFLQGGGAV